MILCPYMSSCTSHTHLVEVLGLDLVSGLAHLTGSLCIRKHQLVDDDVVCVDAALGQLLDQALRLVQGQELGDAHADERRLLLFPHTGRRGKKQDGLELCSPGEGFKNEQINK